MKKLLIISPTPTHPQNAGNRARIFSFVEEVKKIGIDVYMLYATYEGKPSEEMIKYWGAKLYVIDTGLYIQNSILKRIYMKILRILKFKIPVKIKYNYLLDDWYSPEISKSCVFLSKVHKFDFVLSEYIFMSKALNLFNQETIKIIDTHDCFTNRYKVYSSSNGKPISSWFSTYRKEEKKGLNRADRIIAIQTKEADYFRKLIHKPIFTIGHLFDDLTIDKESNTINHKILIFASENQINIDGYNNFIKTIWPILKTKLPSIELIVAGMICEKIEKEPNITYLGFIEDKEKLYNSVSLSLNTMISGTGLKIKTLESLIYGIPVVTTSNGALGLEKMVNKCIFVSDNPVEFIRHIVDLLTESKLYTHSKKNIFKHLKLYQTENNNNLRNLFNQTT